MASLAPRNRHWNPCIKHVRCRNPEVRYVFGVYATWFVLWQQVRLSDSGLVSSDGETTCVSSLEYVVKNTPSSHTCAHWFSSSPKSPDKSETSAIWYRSMPEG